MRITRDLLLKLAKDTVEKRFVPDRNVTAVFLIGSVRPEDAIIPAVTDVDLLVIYNGIPPRDREIVKFSNEVHLDILYEPASLYAKPRELRGDPWRGWMMWDPQLLHEKGKFFEYTQSILRAQFDDPANILKRARYFSVPAREAWSAMTFNPESTTPFKVLTAASNAANALCSLTGAPLAERRLLADFPARADLLGLSEMTAKLLAILCANLDTNVIRQALPTWEESFKTTAQISPDARIHPARLDYYKSAIMNQLEGDIPAAAFWPLLHTWALVVENESSLPKAAMSWDTFCSQIGLGAEGLPARLEALDAFLDGLEETLEQKAAENGL